MKTMMLVALALFASIVPQTAKATINNEGFLKASELLDRCKAYDRYFENEPTSRHETENVVYCLAYVKAWAETISTVRRLTDPNGNRLTVTFQPTFTVSQIVHAFQNFLANNPQEGDLDAHWALFEICELAKILRTSKDE